MTPEMTAEYQKWNESGNFPKGLSLEQVTRYGDYWFMSTLDLLSADEQWNGYSLEELVLAVQKITSVRVPPEVQDLLLSDRETFSKVGLLCAVN